MPDIDFSKIPKVLHDVAFDISDDEHFDPYGLKITNACQKALDNSYQLAMNGTFMGAQKIRNYIRLYPSIPMFKNHLWQYQILVGHLDMAEEAALLAVQEHPGYFYSRLMVANLAQQGEDTNSLILELVGRGVR